MFVYGRTVLLLLNTIGAVPPHLVDRVPYKPPPTFPPRVAYIEGIYEIDTVSWEAMKPRVRTRMAAALNVSENYVELLGFDPIVLGQKCTKRSMLCTMVDGAGLPLSAPGIGGNGGDGNLAATDPGSCVATTPMPPPPELPDPEWEPEYPGAPYKPDDEDDLDDLVWRTTLCVSETNTSLMNYPAILNRTWITGQRNAANSKLFADPEEGIRFELHIIGVITTRMARFYNKKFILDGVIPLPLIQPEVVDETQVYTNPLNLTIKIFGLRQGPGRSFDPDIPSTFMEHIPVCRDPPVPVKGCFRVSFNFCEHPTMTEYRLRSMVLWRKHIFVEVASDVPYPKGEFNVSQGPWPTVKWLVPSAAMVGPWRKQSFPQTEWVYEEECRHERECMPIPVAPSARYLHSVVMYETWDFQQHAFKYLCNEEPSCQRDCLTNLTCLGGKSYFDSNFFFGSIQFRDDDDGVTPTLGLESPDCPKTCCKNRRLCMRTRDVMGLEVPFNAVMMLIFGGRTYKYEVDPGTGLQVYHGCERIPTPRKTEWLSCNELITSDLWRYNMGENKWEFLKPESAISPTTGKPVGFPLARYGHGAVLIEETEGADPGQKRLYMYIYGGLGPQCPQGSICNDVWRYEIAWAAQAYYPKFPGVEWLRGNIWNRLADCPFGGRYRHEMVATSGQDYIYVSGGQGIGTFFDDLFRYRVSTDAWEDLQPYGRKSLTRLMYDYTGQARIMSVALEEYEPQIDVDCEAAWYTTGRFAHCQVCPMCRLEAARKDGGGSLPAERGDFSMVAFPDTTEGAVDDNLVIFGGYRTTWGSMRDASADCGATSSTTTVIMTPAVITTTPPLVGLPPGAAMPQTTGGSDVFNALATKQTSTTSATTTAAPVAPAWPSPTPPSPNVPSAAPSVTTSTTLSILNENASFEDIGISSTTTTTSPNVVLTTLPPPPEYAGLILPVVNGGANASIAEGSPSTTLTTSGQEEFCAPPDAKYYFDDVWFYQPLTNQWTNVPVDGDKPSPRRGHRMIARRKTSNDTQFVLYGGHRQDQSLSEFWVLDMNRPRNKRKWSRLDPFFPSQGLRPPSMSHFSMVFPEKLGLIVLFGGIGWSETDVERTDEMRNVDRRCFKRAQGLPEEFTGVPEWVFLQSMRKHCVESQFCCAITESGVLQDTLRGVRIRTINGSLNATAISRFCRDECAAKEFYPKFHAVMTEGVWTYNVTACPGDCNGHGNCEMSACVCEVGWYGTDCSYRTCPGTTCYTTERTMEQFCIECSQHGVCIDGECQCQPGWTREDCSALLCEDNCSSTPQVTRGLCVDDFPVNQCICFGPFYGATCNETACLNQCSGRGTCDANGTCACDANFHGDDCSLFVFPLQDSPAYNP